MQPDLNLLSLSLKNRSFHVAGWKQSSQLSVQDLIKNLPRDRKRRIRELPPRIFDVVQNGVPRLPVAAAQDADVRVELVLAHQEEVVEEQRRHVVLRGDEVVPLGEQPLPQGLGSLLLGARVPVQDGADDVVAGDVQLLTSGRLSLLLLLLLLLLFAELLAPICRRLLVGSRRRVVPSEGRIRRWKMQYSRGV